MLGGVLRRAEQAARERPAIAELADRAAAWFVGGVLVLAAGVAIGWLLHDPSRVIPVLVSVLVVTCPCALSLATPAAVTAALGALARAGLIVTRANAVERLALATHCLADKTGTLTEGRFRLQSVSTLAGVSQSRCLALAGALERYATHPVASAFVAAGDGRTAADAQSGVPECDSRSPDSGSGTWEFGTRAAGQQAGACGQDTTNAARQDSPAALEVGDASAHSGGVAGRIGEVLHAVGSLQFVAGACGLVVDAESDPGPHGEKEDGTRVYLSREGELLARFILADALRAGARGLVEGLRARGIETTIASGDSAGAVERAAVALGVRHHLCGALPRGQARRGGTARGARRAGADARRRGQRCPRAGGCPRLGGDGTRCGGSRHPRRRGTHRRHPGHAGRGRRHRPPRTAHREAEPRLGPGLHNLVALPLAAAGAVPPWAAAIGMSLSSLAVAGNALRLSRTPAATRRADRGGRSLRSSSGYLVVVVLAAVAGIFVWAVRSGQFDDLDTPAVRILTDDDESDTPH